MPHECFPELIPFILILINSNTINYIETSVVAVI